MNRKNNGKGKEYYKRILLFEGEYLNGQRWNGKEYEYNDGWNCYGKLKFEIECLNGERNGKGKEYDDNGRLIFEGEYLNGKRNGKGKKYDKYGRIIFEGEYLNGEKSKGINKVYDEYVSYY